MAVRVQAGSAPGRGRRRAPGLRDASGRLWRASPVTYLTLVVTILLSVFPLYWMVVAASRTNAQVGDVPPPLFPGGNLGENVQRVLDNGDANFLLGLWNSAVASTTVAVSVMLFSSLAGFAFAKLRFRGRNVLMLVILATMMVPVQMGIIPLYMIMVELGWTGEIQAVIVPFLVTGFGVFMMRQYASQAVPDELIEAARVDGASTIRIYWNVVMPALRPAMAVLGLFTFMQTWNEFMWPYLVLSSTNPTVQFSISLLNEAYSTDYTAVFAGTLMSTVPLLVVFILFGRQIIGGIMEGAIKA
jgi:cellobiose transport system permease protein